MREQDEEEERVFPASSGRSAKAWRGMEMKESCFAAAGEQLGLNISVFLRFPAKRVALQLGSAQVVIS